MGLCDSWYPLAARAQVVGLNVMLGFLWPTCVSDRERPVGRASCPAAHLLRRPGATTSPTDAKSKGDER